MGLDILFLSGVAVILTLFKLCCILWLEVIITDL